MQQHLNHNIFKFTHIQIYVKVLIIYAATFESQHIQIYVIRFIDNAVLKFIYTVWIIAQWKKKKIFFWQYFFAHLLSNGANLDLSKWVSSLNVSFKCLQDMNCHSSFFHPSWTTRNILKVKQWRHRYDVVIFSKFSTKGLKVMLTNLTLSWRRFLSFRN